MTGKLIKVEVISEREALDIYENLDSDIESEEKNSLSYLNA